jgi:hypothetical protein
MSDFDEVIRAAREGFEPEAADRERVWTSLAARVGGAGAVAALLTKTSVSAAATTGALAGQSVGALTKLFFVSVAVTLAGSGAVVGVTRFAASTREPPPVVPSRAPSAGPAAIASTPAASVDRADAMPKAASGPTVTGEPGRRPGVVAPHATEEAARRELARELTLLREVRRASERGEHARAEQVLDRLDEQHPQGTLMEERAALRAVAACGARSTSGAARVRDFLRRYPASVYASKVERVCGSDSTRDDAAESSTKSFTDPIDGGH